LKLLPQKLWAPQAWVGQAWAQDVMLHVGENGRWASVATGVARPAKADDVQVLAGPVLPGLVNAHSHAFQRAFVGLAERREGAKDAAQDDFWSWRDRMYGVALRITPEQLHSVARHLYSELLQGGYTHTCEFHYLHHAPDGKAYADEATMCRAVVQAAVDTGMGLTVLPVLYKRAGFAAPQLRADQRRFAADAARVLRLRDAVRGYGLTDVFAGVAVHSLRAAGPAAMHELVRLTAGDPGPLHLHIAEQMGEVRDCLAATGARPIEWLAREMPLDARWQLVHATHATRQEIAAVATTGAGVVLCPSTEANLGDGLCDLPAWLSSGTPLALGSDSQVTRNWPEELRWLEYGQRLKLQQRNIAAAPPGQAATAGRLFNAVLQGGATAAGAGTGLPAGLQAGLCVGNRADLLVVNTSDPAFAGTPPSRVLDALVFAGPALPFSQVMTAGRWVTASSAAEHEHKRERAAQAIAALAQGTD
jgi:formimidoylglutamate deiminase